MDERTYKTLVTAAGKAKIAAAVAGGTLVNVTEAAVGDGGGSYYFPTEDMTELKNEVWRGAIASKEVNMDSPNMTDVKVVIPADVGGWTIREAGIFDEDGTMICVCNLPDAEKVIISTGASGTLTLVMHLVITDADHVQFFIDPTMDIVTAGDVERMIKVHNEDITAHGIQRSEVKPLLAAGDHIIVADSEDEDRTKKLPAGALASGMSFTIRVPLSAWSGEGPYTQTVSDERFVADARYTYVIGMNGSSQAGYEGGSLWANEVSTDGQITLVSKDEQKADLTLNILRISTFDEGGPGTNAKTMSMIGADSAMPIPTQLIITTPPLKQDYYVNDVFDPKGMVVEVVFSGGMQVQVEAYRVEPSGPLTEGTDHVTISYTEEDKTVSAEQPITVKRESFAIPRQKGTLTYDGNAHQPVWDNYLPAKMSLSGDTSKVAAGTYTATFTLLDADRYQWSDGETGAKKIQWTIAKQGVTLPTQSGTLTYNAGAQSPVWKGNDAGKFTVAGDTSKTNAGTYYAQFTPTANYMWSDNSGSEMRKASWVINKAAGSLSISPKTLSLNVGTKSAVITVNRAGNGAISAVSSQTGTASTSISGNKITVTGLKTGSAVITVNVAAGTNHTAPTAVTCSVSVTLPVSTLNSNTWAVIKQASDANQGANYWKVGDKKNIKINGKVGNTTFSNLSIDVFILGFNHNSAKEGANKIHFALGKINDKLVGLVDSQYNNTTSDNGCFTMNTSSTNTGGWQSSHMRTVILGGDKAPASAAANTLLAALPSDLKAVIKPVTKYTDNKGGGNNNAGNVTATTDYLWLLAEFEIQGARSYANSTEQANQLQYDYFKASNPKIVYKHSATNDAACAWLRSPYYDYSHTFCIVNTDGSATNTLAYYSLAMLAGFAA